MLFVPVRFFFFNDTATTEIYTLSLHDALPICGVRSRRRRLRGGCRPGQRRGPQAHPRPGRRSGAHTSEPPSRPYILCRLLVSKKKTTSRAPASAPDPSSTRLLPSVCTQQSEQI